MKSHTTKRFRKAFEKLPHTIQQQAQEAFVQFQQNPYHPSLQFKRIHSSQPIYSARISLNYRAVGIVEESTIIWFWIGSHEDYNNLLNRL